MKLNYVRPKINGPRQDQQCGDWPFRLGRYFDCEDEFSTTGSLLMFCSVLDHAWREHDTEFLQQGYYDAYGDLFELDLPRLFAIYKKQPANPMSASNP